MRRNNRIKSIHSSLKIEANSLSLGQVRDVMNGKTILGEQKEIQEVKNAYAAYEKFSEIEPYSIKSLKLFHGIMTKYVVEESGGFRRNYLRPAIDMNLIRMTIPDKPNSRNQRYVKV